MRTTAPLALVVVVALATSARAQETPQLPPPPPPSSPPQYVPPPAPPPGQATPPPQPAQRREKEREPAPRHEREREHEKEREREVVRPRYAPPPPPPVVVVRDEPPPARRWFQIGFRSGVSIPAGSISGASNDSMGNDFNFQVPFFLELGVKVHPMIFLGAYTSLSLGGVSQTFANAQGCTQANPNRGCMSTDWRIGLEVQVHFRPAERVNPWVGYGIGFEQASASASGGGAPGTGESFSGLELARLTAGLDLRASRIVGFGPFFDVDLGSYSGEHVQGANQTVDQSIPNTALHEWFTIGLRGVIYP